jgi:hypothetical protein
MRSAEKGENQEEKPKARIQSTIEHPLFTQRATGHGHSKIET